MSEIESRVPQLRQARKIDKLQAWKLRIHNKLTYDQIAEVMHCSRQAVQQACERLSRLIPDPEEARAYQEVRPDILNAVEGQLLASLTCPEKISKASLNNVAYAITQVSSLRRLETGQSTSNIATLTKLIGSSDDHLFPSKDKNSGQNTQSTDVSSENVG